MSYSNVPSETGYLAMCVANFVSAFILSYDYALNAI